MPDNNGKPSEKFREAKACSSWWYKAKDFMIRGSAMCDVGGNVSLKLSGNNFNAGIVNVVMARVRQMACMKSIGDNVY